MNSLKRFAYCSGWTVEISAAACKAHGDRHNQTHCQKIELTRVSLTKMTIFKRLLNASPSLTPCLTAFAACAAFFLVSYCVSTSIRPMKYTSRWGAPEGREFGSLMTDTDLHTSTVFFNHCAEAHWGLVYCEPRVPWKILFFYLIGRGKKTILSHNVL